MSLSSIERLALAQRALDGLSVGDAFGETFFARSPDPAEVFARIDARLLPDLRVCHTLIVARAASTPTGRVELLPGPHVARDTKPLATWACAHGPYPRRVIR